MRFLKFALFGLVLLAGAFFASPDTARAEGLSSPALADAVDSVKPDVLSQYRRYHRRGYYGRPRYYGRRHYYAPRYYAPRRHYRRVFFY